MWISDKVITTKQNNFRLMIAHSGEIAVSETFIQAHIDLLPAQISFVHGRPVKLKGKLIASIKLPHRAYRKIDRAIRRKRDEWEITRSYTKAIKAIEPHFVLAEYGMTGVAVMEACVSTDTPLIVHFHGYDASVRDILDRNSEDYRHLFQVSSAVIAVSRHMEKRLVALGANRETLHYNPYGVDVSKFANASPLSSTPTFIAVGRFVEKKAPHLTLLAFNEVLKELPDVRLRMIGTGPLLPVCKDLAMAMGIDHAVTFLGAQPPEVVQREMSEARAFVQHSVEAANGDCEGTPVAVLEAGASGLPVIATRHAGIPDVVIESETGLLVDERNTNDMAEQMIKLAKDPVLAEKLGKNARRHICNQFTQSQSIDRLWSIIKSTLKR